MATREELTAAMEKLQGELADLDENDYECAVEVDGKKTYVKGSTAKAWLMKHGLIDAPAENDGADGDGDDGKDDKPKKTGTKFFD